MNRGRVVGLLWVLLKVFTLWDRGKANDYFNDYDDNIFLPNIQWSETFDIRNDLPVQDARILRGISQEVTNISTSNHSQVEQKVSNSSDTVDANAGGDAAAQEWLREAIKDVAYYLRAHKFNEYDRRYEANGANAPRTYHREHPRPALRSLHWEVHKYCDESFLACIKYLWKRAQGADLRRGDDTAVVIQEQKWRMESDRERINMVDSECQKLQRRDGILAEPFLGPLERFQWRTTAAYFMCWYAMNEVEHLRHLGESCDNFANCLDRQHGPNNGDPRARDNVPFACATYSFCPDPCCYEKHTLDLNACTELPNSNPCHAAAPPTQRECVLNKSRNLDFTSGILIHWNVTCACPQAGFVWDSSYGICVDVDECLHGLHKCDVRAGEACLNTVGGFRCVCKWGYTWSGGNSSCAKNEAVSQIKLNALKMLAKLERREPLEKSYLRRMYKYFKRLIVPAKPTNSSSTSEGVSQFVASHQSIVLTRILLNIFIVALI